MWIPKNRGYKVETAGPRNAGRPRSDRLRDQNTDPKKEVIFFLKLHSWYVRSHTW